MSDRKRIENNRPLNVSNALNEHIWIGGKGPSLTKYDWAKAGRFRLGVNEAALHIPKCWGAIALDHNVLHYYQQKLDKRIIVFHPRTDKFNFKFPIQHLVDVPLAGSTLVRAFQVCYQFGFRYLHCVGIDSRMGDNKHDPNIKVCGRSSHKYNTINTKCDEIAEILGLTVEYIYV